MRDQRLGVQLALRNKLQDLSAVTAIHTARFKCQIFAVHFRQRQYLAAIIQRNDAERAKQVFNQYCPGWTDEKYAEAEAIVSGLEYATLKTNTFSPSLEMRIAGALETILATFNVPEELRKTKIQKVLGMDFRSIGRRVLKEFKEFVQKTNDETFESMFSQIRRTTIQSDNQ